MSKIVSAVDMEIPDFPPGISLGRIIFEKLKVIDLSTVGMIDGVTKESITFGQILENAIKVALRLKKVDIGYGDHLLLMSENSIHYLTYVLAALFIGAVSCPISPTSTEYELNHTLDLLKPKLYICSKTALKVLQETRDDIQKDFIWIIGEIPDEKNTDRFRPDDFDPTITSAAILMSSGTTGFPKGVVITHESFIGNLVSFGTKHLLHTLPGDSTAGLLPFYHVLGMVIGLSHMYYQWKVIVLVKFKPEVFLNTIQEYKLTKLFLVPPLALFLAKSPIVLDYDLSSVNHIICGAAPLGTDIQQAVEERINIKISQGYGLSECGILAMTPPKSTIRKIGASGILVPHTTAKVVSMVTNDKLGPNEVGELCFKSRRNMRCYLGNEEATKQTIDDEGFVHTGDIGYYDEDGYFFIVDRLKELIKYKGFQVAPAELEDIIMGHKAVKDAAVIGVPNERAGELPFALVVRQPGSTVTAEEIIQFVSGLVSGHKRLSGGVKFVEQIPKNPSGNILRRVLREKYSSEKLMKQI